MKNGFEIQNKKGCYKVDLITPVLGSNLRELNNNGTDIKRNEDGFFLKRRNEVNVFDISIIGDLSVNINSILNCDFFDNSSKLLVVTQKPIENLSNSLVNTNDWQILNICNLKQ